MKPTSIRTVARILCVAALGAGTSLQSQVVDKTPVLHLSFDSVSGVTVSNTGSGGSAMNGTLNSAVGSATIVPGGMFGNCLSISGVASSDASCRIANAVVPLNVGAGQPGWSVAMWIQTTTPGGCYAYQGDGGWGGGNTTFYLTSGRSGGGTSGTHAGAVRNGQEWEEGTTDVNDGLWHHFVLTFDGTTKVMYLDGNVETFDENNWSGNGVGNQFWIGGGGTGQGDGQVSLNGLIDEVYVFNRALSLADVQLLTNNIVPTVPVAATVSPNSGYRGQVFTVTATATPAVGTVTNATVDLSAIGLSATGNLVESSANVFTNSFTVPATSPIVAAALKVTVISTEPLAGSANATFTVVALPPTNAIVLTPITGASVYEYTEASFHFAATNDAPIGTTNDVGFPMTYEWYKGGVLVSTNPMGPYYTFLTTPADNGTNIYAIARVADTNFSSISVTSAVVTLTVNPGSLVYTNGLKREFFAGASRQAVEIGNTRPGLVSLVSQAQLPGGSGANYSQRFSGYFIPQTNDAYVFFIASDDDCDLFLSTNSAPANKLLIAQEAGWSGTLNWQTVGGGGSTAGQKRSDQWSPDGGTTVPYAGGINLQAGQKYYIEAVMHQGGGGDNWAITYQTETELTTIDPSQPADGTASRMTAASNNIAVITWPGTIINWTLQPLSSVTVFEGQSTNFSAIAVSDAEMVPNYQWFIVTNGGAFPGTPLTGQVANGTNTTLSLIPPNYSGAQIYSVASTEEGGLSITSSVSTLTVIQSVFEPGFVSEKKWMNVFNIGGAENGSIGTPTFSCVRPGFVVGLDNPGAGGSPNGHDSTLQQIGYFVAPTDGDYVFFITSHDGGDLFLSTDNTAGNKRLVAQELGWSNNWLWNQAGGGGSVVSQKRSDSYSPDGGVTTPYATGIPLLAGQRYYMEVDHTTSLWGNEQVGVTYSLTDLSTAPADGSFPNAFGTNVAMTAIRCSYVAITKQPASVAVVEGASAHFSVAGTSDSLYPICSVNGYTITAPTNTIFGQWYKILGGVTNAIPGAIETSVTVGPLTAADNGAQFYCAVRALGYADNSLNPIYSNSQPATVTVTARTNSLLGHWFNGTASLADSANYLGSGVYDAGVIRTNRSYYFTNDVPPGAPSGALSFFQAGAGIVISNTATGDAGYAVDTFDGNIRNQMTIAFWAKGIPSQWNPWLCKYGENGRGWQVRQLGYTADRPTFTLRGSLGTGGDDPFCNLAYEATRWHYYAGTLDTTTGIRRLYLDGQLGLEDTGNGPYTLSPAEHLTLGARDSNAGTYGNFFTGGLYDVRIYNYALTQKELADIGHLPPPFTSAITDDGFGNKQLEITFPYGTLLQATNVMGPWTTNSTVSPATIPISTTEPQMFFMLRDP